MTGHLCLNSFLSNAQTEKNSCGIAWFPCDITAFLLVICPCGEKVFGNMLSIVQYNKRRFAEYKITGSESELAKIL